MQKLEQYEKLDVVKQHDSASHAMIAEANESAQSFKPQKQTKLPEGNLPNLTIVDDFKKGNEKSSLTANEPKNFSKDSKDGLPSKPEKSNEEKKELTPKNADVTSGQRLETPQGKPAPLNEIGTASGITVHGASESANGVSENEKNVQKNRHFSDSTGSGPSSYDMSKDNGKSIAKPDVWRNGELQGDIGTSAKPYSWSGTQGEARNSAAKN